MPLRRSTIDAVDAASINGEVRGRRDLRLEREEARHERALHHADVDGLADVHDEAEDLREDVRSGGDVEAVDAGGPVQRQGQWAKTGLTHARLTPAPSHVHTHATTKTKNWSLTHDASCTICKQKKHKHKTPSHDRGPRRRALGLLEVVHDPVARRRPGERVPHPRAAGQALDGLAPRANHSTCGAFA